MAKKEKKGFFYDNTVEVTDEHGKKVRCWKGEEEAVKAGFAKRKKALEEKAKASAKK